MWPVAKLKHCEQDVVVETRDASARRLYKDIRDLWYNSFRKPIGNTKSVVVIRRVDT
jgi:hypothetical protein